VRPYSGHLRHYGILHNFQFADALIFFFDRLRILIRLRILLRLRLLRFQNSLDFRETS